MAPKKEKNGLIIFKDYPGFTPNLTPQEIFEMGSFGGTYWRPIYSSILKKEFNNQHKKYPKSWWKNLSEHWLTSGWDDYDKTINKYNVKVGTTLEYWEEKKWINETHPYGWTQWYCDFYSGKRSDDDERQIKRWMNTAGPKSRFRRNLINQIHKKKTKYDDYEVSPKIRQTLQHWGYELQKSDV